MKFRLARHTTNLAAIQHFYHEILGLEILGGFTHHKGYDGLFLGIKGENWHLEFTVSDEKPNHTVDADDLLVFYIAEKKVFDALLAKLYSFGYEEIASKNPYWQENGHLFLDPDGYGVMIVPLAVE